ncbi:unnamed protein product, partial [Pleuronectes platessa]
MGDKCLERTGAQQQPPWRPGDEPKLPLFSCSPVLSLHPPPPLKPAAASHGAGRAHHHLGSPKETPVKRHQTLIILSIMSSAPLRPAASQSVFHEAPSADESTASSYFLPPPGTSPLHLLHSLVHDLCIWTLNIICTQTANKLLSRRLGASGISAN